jgi:S-adenosylmethionine uptake transporter
MRNDLGPAPVIAATLGILALSIMDGLIKAVAPHYPTLVTVLMRFAFGGVVALAFYLAAGAPRASRETLAMAALRAVFIVASAGLFFAALGRLPLVEAIALTFVAPIVIAILGRVVLRETVGVGAVAGIALGLAGLAVMLGDQLLGASGAAHDPVGVACALLSTLTYAISIIILRARATRDPLPVLVLLQNLLPALYVAPLAGAVWVTPTSDHLWLFAVMGALGALGHVCLTWAFARANAARLGVVEYTALVWGAVIGFVWFAETPGLATLVGSALIVAGALCVGWAKRA